MHQRHVDLGALPAPLAEAGEHERQPDVVALFPQRPVEPPPRDSLLRRGPLRPLLKQLRKPRPHLLQHRARARALPRLRHRRRQVAPDGVAREPHLPRHLSLALALDKHLAPERVDVLHFEHPLPPNLVRLPPTQGWAMLWSGRLLDRSLVGF